MRTLCHAVLLTGVLWWITDPATPDVFRVVLILTGLTTIVVLLSAQKDQPCNQSRTRSDTGSTPA